jgi:elongation factor P
MITPIEFHEGTIFEDAGQVLEVLTFQHHRMSQSRAVVRCKLRNLITGSIVEQSYRPSDKYRDVPVERREKTYLYTENGMAHFMDVENFEQVEMSVEKIGVGAKFLAENMTVLGVYLDDKFFAVELPANVTMKVTSTVPGIKGDSVSNMTKPATLENGLELLVPLFIKEGDKIKVDTRDGKYVERVQ